MLWTVRLVAVSAFLLAAGCSSTTAGNGTPGTGPATGSAPPSGGPATSGAPPTMSQASDPAPPSGELTQAASIPGVTYQAEDNREHENGTLRYDSSPPIGGAHAPVWADCAGTVYPQPIANENAVHSLEHGALWVTYRPGLPADQLGALTARVNGNDRMFMSPYPGLPSAISLQTWGYQLRVDSASDPRVQTFIDLLRYNPLTTPEYGATCGNPTFKENPSTPGHPIDG